MKRFWASSLLILSTLLVVAADLSARKITCQVLQQKLGRLYFSAGKEADIWPGCKWALYQDSTGTTEPIAKGIIAQSYEGISVSDSNDFGSYSLQSIKSVIIYSADSVFGQIGVVAAIDLIDQSLVGDSLTGGIVTYAIRWSADEVGSDFQNQQAKYYTKTGINTYPEETDASVAVSPTSSFGGNQSGTTGVNTDAFVSYSQSDCGAGKSYFSSPAPFLVALIPNISRPINRNALLTTALRYKIDTAQLSSAFEYESVPQQSFLTNNPQYSAYVFDTDKSKRLLKENKSASASVSFDSYSPTLGSTARFIRGTLVKAGYTTTAVHWNDPSDLRLMIVPLYSDSPWVALREILNSVAKDTVAKDRSNEPVRLADHLLADARETADPTQKSRLLQRVDRILMEDIGAFPLFRPIIHICVKEDIRGIRFDKDGRLDIRNIYQLKLPGDSTENKP